MSAMTSFYFHFILFLPHIFVSERVGVMIRKSVNTASQCFGGVRTKRASSGRGVVGKGGTFMTGR